MSDIQNNLKTIDSLPSLPEGFDVQSIPEQVSTEEKIEKVEHQQTITQEVEQPISNSERNLAALRELKQRAERERDEALRRLAEFESRGNIDRNSMQNAQEDDNFVIGNDELAEGKHLNKVDRKIKKLEDTIRQHQQQTAASYVEARLKIEYPDIEKVISKENIDILSVQYPELAATINSSSDLYNKAVSAYTLIKKLGIQPEDNYQNDRARAQANASKPRPLTSISPQQGDSPLSHANAFANGLTDELKAQLLKEMMNSRR